MRDRASHWDEMTPRERDRIGRRSHVLESAKHAAAVLDNEDRPYVLREYARNLYAQCSEILLRHNDPEKRFVLVPLSFHVRDFYRELWADTLARLPDQVVADNPVQVLMGGKAADLVDSSYSTAFRLESLEAFNAVLANLEAEAAHHLSLVKSAGNDGRLVN